MTGALIGAIVRDGVAIFPHGDDVLLPGDRVIVFTESARVPDRRARSVSRTRLGVDVSRRSTSSARLIKFLSLAFARPAAIAVGYRRVAGPLPARDGDRLLLRLGARAADPR